MKIKALRLLFAFLVLVAMLATTPFTSADPISVTGSGTWDPDTATTAYSAGGAAWQFYLVLPSATLTGNPTTQGYNFAYYLNGALVSTTLPGGILFYPSSEGGGFDLFTDGQTGVNIVSLFFAGSQDVGSSLHLALGTYATSIGLNDGELHGTGSGTVTITPEPPTVLLLGTSLLITSSVISWRRNGAMQSK